MKKILLILVVTAFIHAETMLPQIIDIYEHFYSGSSSTATATLHIKTPSRERNVTFQRLTKGENCLIKALTPAQDKGVGSLNVGKRVWDYSPKSGKVIPVVDSMFSTSWMGSDFTYDDIFRPESLEANYTVQLLPKDPKEPTVRQIKCTPKIVKPNLWGFMLIAVNEKLLVPVRVRCFDSQRRLLRTINYKSVVTINGKSIPSVIEIIPATKNGYSSRLIFSSLQFDLPCDDANFTLTKLREPL